MTLVDFLVYLAGGGSLVAASWILNQIPGYITLSEKLRQWLFFLLAVIFGGGSYAVSQYVSVAVLTAISPYFLIAAFAFSAIFLKDIYTKVSDVAKSLKILSAKK
jgi:hypothetical protein